MGGGTGAHGIRAGSEQMREQLTDGQGRPRLVAHYQNLEHRVVLSLEEGKGYLGGAVVRADPGRGDRPLADTGANCGPSLAQVGQGLGLWGAENLFFSYTRKRPTVWLFWLS